MGFYKHTAGGPGGAFSARSEEYANVLKETIDGYEVIHTSNQSGNFLNRFEQVSSQKQRAYFSYGFARSMSAKTLYTIASLTNIVGIGVGGFLILQRKPERCDDAGSYRVLFRNFQQPFEPY